MVVCHCERVNDRTIDAAICAGARDLDGVTSRCRAGAQCGGCHAVIEALLDQRTAPTQRAGTRSIRLAVA